jgi:predicted lysophospholipase L1 biosynthesis ABC-type transport system permease subunit
VTVALGVGSGTALFSVMNTLLFQSYSRGLFVVARLDRGVTLTAANQEIAGISDRLAAEVPSQYRGWVTQFIPLRHQTMEDLDSRPPTKLLLLIGGSGLLLLNACSNVANLLLARSLVRTRDRAIRAALGATPGRLLRQTCTENLVLALLGGILGIILALWLTPWLLRLSPIQPIAFAEHLRSPVVDWPVLGFAVGASLITALLISLPALRRATNLDLRAIIQSGGSATGSTSGTRWREGLVISQLALALTLLAGAALLVKSFTRLQATPLGFEPGGILAARVALPEQRYASHSDRRRFVDAVLSKPRTMPGVRSAGTTTTLPLHLDGWNAGLFPSAAHSLEIRKPT